MDKVQLRECLKTPGGTHILVRPPGHKTVFRNFLISSGALTTWTIPDEKTKHPLFSQNFGQILTMVWLTHPGYASVLILNTIFLSLVPLGTAWLTKRLFDWLVQDFQDQLGSGLTTSLLFLLLALGGLNVLTQALGTVSHYLNAELGRQFNRKVPLSIYRKIIGLQGLSPFESPQFYDMIQLGSQGAQRGFSQAFNVVTSLLRSLIILASFLGVLVSYSPILAGLVTLTALAQFFVQTKLGRQRFGLAFENNPKQRRLSYYGHLLSGRPFAKEMRLFDLGAHFLATFDHLSQQIQQIQSIQQKRELFWKFGLEILSRSLLKKWPFFAPSSRA